MHPRTDDPAELVSTFDDIARRFCLTLLWVIFLTSAAAEFLIDRIFVIPAVSSFLVLVWGLYRFYTRATPDDEHAVSYERREG